ncbi:MAG: S8 family serine peptidase, partial [Lentisphaerae bacterium]|nr:S8 family serine peptidase [Lentisphaerota bacterium]
MASAERERRAAAEIIARRRGLPIRGKYPGGGGFELAGFEGDTPLYRTTLNRNAGISTAANLLWPLPYGVTGAGGTVGVWDEAAVRTTHQEFGGRVAVKDGVVELSAHSTHVAGTVGAAGADAAAKGMAPEAYVDCYDWNYDLSEMTSRGATYPGEPGMIYLSNHSYGYNAGWVYTETPAYTWYGSGTTAAGYEDDFGKYNDAAQEIDELAFGLPYYLMFWAAGNDRANNPANGSSVALSPGGVSVTYDSALHPAGDENYKGGFDTISYNALAKNVVTVGSVRDAVNNGLRSLSGATMEAYSSWGPADDGRIKPDLVANGYSLYSAVTNADNKYAYSSGTSMATPNAAGTAHLLTSHLAALFTNTAMRASTLKALLIHTADDLGNPGPDYRFGWGLVNARAAADLLAAYRTNAAARGVVEDRVTTARQSVDVPFVWDGAGPIRATLCWTDPAGGATTAHDSRDVRLVHNLDLRIIGPDSGVYQPWVMPFVGDWSVAACDYYATTGSNRTDNVEQVLIAAPGMAGTYTARV